METEENRENSTSNLTITNCKTGFNNLPLEIISYIFEFFPYPYFQDFRLVCRKWYDATLTPKLLNQEKVVCVEHLGEQLPTTLMRSRRDFYNLVFQGGYCKTQEKPEDNWWWDWCVLYEEKFWKRIGSCVTSLSLRQCGIYLDDLLKFLAYCPQLQCLSFQDFYFINKSKSSESCSLKLLALESLELLDDNSLAEETFIDIEVLDRLVSIGPNLKSLILKFKGVKKREHPPWLEPPYYEHVWDMPMNGLTPGTVMEYLREKSIVEFRFGGVLFNYHDEFVELVMNHDLTLQWLQIPTMFSSEIASRLKLLQSLSIEEKKVEGPELEIICNELKDLKSLGIKTSAYTYLSSLSLLQNLTCLSLSLLEPNRPSAEPDEHIVAGLCSQVNTRLKELQFDAQKLQLSPNTYARLPKCYPAVTRLTIKYHCCAAVAEVVIQAISKYQVFLKSLSLLAPCCGYLSVNGLYGKRLPDEPENSTGFSIGNLKNLQKFTARFSSRKEAPLSEGFVVHELRHLELYCKMMDQKDMMSVIRNHPNIETLTLQGWFELKDEHIDEIIETWKRLKYIALKIYSTASRPTEDGIQKLRRHFKRVRILYG